MAEMEAGRPSSGNGNMWASAVGEEGGEAVVKEAEGMPSVQPEGGVGPAMVDRASDGAV
jgi:hypothetical protein